MHRTNITFDAQPNLTHIYQLNQLQFINWNVEWHKFPMLSHHRKCLWILNHAEYIHSIKSCVYAYNSTNIRLFNRFHHQLLHKIILKVLCLRLISLNIIQIHRNVHTYRICCQSCTLKMWKRHRAAVFHRVNGRQHGMPFKTLPMKYEDEPLCTCVCVYVCICVSCYTKLSPLLNGLLRLYIGALPIMMAFVWPKSYETEPIHQLIEINLHEKHKKDDNNGSISLCVMHCIIYWNHRCRTNFNWHFFVSLHLLHPLLSPFTFTLLLSIFMCREIVEQLRNRNSLKMDFKRWESKNP